MYGFERFHKQGANKKAIAFYNATAVYEIIDGNNMIISRLYTD